MARKASALTAVALSLLPIGQTLLLGTFGIATASSAVVLHAPTAVAQNASSVAQIAKAITVRIEGATQGSGVIVKREGNSYTVLTAWHVVSGNRPGEEIAISTPDRKNHQLEQGSIHRLGEVDMAILSFSSAEVYEVASIGNTKKVKYDDLIYVAGFPVKNSHTLKYEPGEVVANADVGIDQGYQLLYDNKTERGMSGGALLNSFGELIGLHGRGERNEQSSFGKEYVIKTGVNQGVPIRYFSLFRDGKPVVAETRIKTTFGDYAATAVNSMFKIGREQSVRKLAEKALEIGNANDSLLNYLVAYSYLLNNNIEKAELPLLKVSKDSIFYHQAMTALADIYLSKANFKEAFGYSNKAINHGNGPALPYITRGRAYMQIGDYSNAVNDYSTAIRHSYNRKEYMILVDAYIFRANAHKEWGYNSESCFDYKNAINISRKEGVSDQRLLKLSNWINSEEGSWCANSK